MSYSKFINGLKKAGITLDRKVLAEVAAAARTLALDIVQLHGDEDIGPFRAALPATVEIWAATSDGAPARGDADRILFDHGRGGTGQTFDWQRISGRADLARAFLAGGIGPANARAAARVGAFGLDVGSSLEARPGEKDPQAMTALFAALRPPARGDLA